MKIIQNISDVKLIVHGAGAFEPGDKKSVDDNLADQLIRCPEFKIVKESVESEPVASAPEPETEPAEADTEEQRPFYYKEPFKKKGGKKTA